MGMLEHGVYDDDDNLEADKWEDVGEQELQDHLGVEEDPTDDGEHNEGSEPSLNGDSSDSDDEYPVEEEPEQDDELEPLFPILPHVSVLGANWDIPLTHLKECQDWVQREFHQQRVNVGRVACPFDDEERAEFLGQLSEVIEAHYIPQGFGVHEDEPDHQPYNPSGQLSVGHRRNIFLQVSLPESIWKPHIILWLQAVAVLTNMNPQK
jgi:hypothetical protein